MTAGKKWKEEGGRGTAMTMGWRTVGSRRQRNTPGDEQAAGI